MGTRGRRFRLGLFVVLTGVFFLLLLGFILDNSFRSEQADYYIVFEENVKGMVVGSRVNFQGVPVGSVVDMRFQDGKTLVELRIDPTRASIQDVTKARMDRLLVTGQVTVELEGYDKSGVPLPAGSIIEPRADPLNSLRGTIPEIVDRATVVLTRLDGLLAGGEKLLDAGNQARIVTILDNLAGATGHLREQTLPELDGAIADVRALTGRGDGAVADVSAALLRLEPQLAALTDSAEATLRDVAEFTAAVRGPTAALLREAEVFTGSLRTPAQTALASLRQTLDDVRALARQLKLAPNSLLFGVERAAPTGGQ